jgi:hypothetical protein
MAGLFNKGEVPSQPDAGGDTDYFAGYDNAGLENFTADTVSTAYLSMVQPSSAAATTHAPGSWRNSATDENYGKTVEVVVLAFKTVWTERSSAPPYNTIGRYEPNSINVNIDRPKPGQRGFPKMTNPETSNKVEELFVYACMRPDAPEEGIIYFSPTAGSMKTCKAWNAQLRTTRLPDNRIILFGYTWKLDVDLVPNPTNPALKIAKFVKATRGNVVPQALFTQSVKPQIEQANNTAALLVAPEMSGDTE